MTPDTGPTTPEAPTPEAPSPAGATLRDGGVDPRDELVRRAYRAFDDRDLAGMTALLADDVDWPDGERRMHGRAEVARYWSALWERQDVRDEPVAIVWLTATTCVVSIEQTAVARGGADAEVEQRRFAHLLRVDAGSIERLDIVEIR